MEGTLERLLLDTDPADVGIRIDKWLSDHVEHLGRSAVQKLCDNGRVLIDGNPVLKSCKLRGGETIEVLVPLPERLDVLPEDIPLDIVYEDESLLVVNKPKGMVVHPAPGNYTGTLVNALLFHCGDRLSSINGVIRPGIVHRIDKDTSGLLIVAKGDEAHQKLAEQIKAHTFTREYEAVVYYSVKEEEGVVDLPIGRHPTERKRMAVVRQGGRNATTHYRVTARYQGFTHLQLRLETGRTHQIRVHMAYIGHPVVGDEVFGPKKVITQTQGQCLHARKIGFIHPVSGEYMEFNSELPEYFSGFLAKLSPF